MPSREVDSDEEDPGRNKKLLDPEISEGAIAPIKNDDEKTLKAIRQSYGENEGRRIWKNLLALAVAFVLMFSAFGSVTSIQSSVNAKNGLGPYSLAAIQITGCISSLFFLSYILSKISCKMSMVLALCLSLVYFSAQFFPMFLTLIPSGMLVGLCGSTIWTSMSNYVSRISQEYGYITGEDVGVVLSRFFGTFFLIYQTAGIWGNLILAAAFSTVDSSKMEGSHATESALCGANFCPAASGNVSNSTALLRDPPPPSTLNLLFGLYIACIVGATLIMNFCVDPLRRYGEGCKDLQKRPTRTQLLLATFKQMQDPYQMLLIPFLFFSTFQTGFFAIDFTAGYITCAWGIENIGKIMICFSIAAALSSFVFSRAMKYIGRLGVFSIIIAAHLSADIIMLRWSPSETQPIGFFVIAIIAGSVEGVTSAQLTAFLALVFQDNKEAAFNNQRLWQGIGFVVAYINATLFCIEFKLYLLMGVAIIGFIGYVIVEVSFTRKKKFQISSNPSKSINS